MPRWPRCYGDEVLTLLLMLACAPEPDELDCRVGFTRAPSGHCYPDEPLNAPSELDDVYELMEPCTGLRPSEQIDFEAGCAGGLCEGDLYDVALLVLGEPLECIMANGDAYCTWRNGLAGRWDDDDEDGLPDVGTRNQRTLVEPPFVPGSPSGLGVWMPPKCFVDQLGRPDELDLIDSVEGTFVERMNFEAAGLIVYDFYNEDEQRSPDGRMDALYLYGAP